MRLNSTLKTAAIITLLLSCFTTYSQTPFISQLEGMNEGKEAKITMTDGVIDQDYLIQYRLKNATSWIDSPVKIKKSAEVAEGIMTGLETNKDYCFRIIRRDSVAKTEIVSNDVCSAILKYTLFSDMVVNFGWNKINTSGVDEIRVYMTEESERFGKKEFWVIPPSLSDSTSMYTQMFCTANYKAFLSIKVSSLINGEKRDTQIKSPLVSFSPKSFKELITPKGISSASIQDKAIIFSIFDNREIWFRTSKYNIYRSVDNREMVKVGSTNLFTSFEDKEVDIEKKQYWYAYSYENECGIESPLSEKSSTMLLSVKSFNKLVWTSSVVQISNEFERKGVTYTVQIVNNLGQVLDKIYTGADTTFNIDYAIYKSPLKLRILATTDTQWNNHPLPTISYSNTVDYIPAIPPFITQVEGLSEGKEAKISMIDGNMGESYTIQYRLKNTVNWFDSPVKIKKSSDFDEGTAKGLETNKNYCFRLIKRDSLSKTEILSNEVCSIQLKSTLLSDKAVKLEWSKIDTTGVTRVFIVQMDEEGKTINSYSIRPITDTVFVFDQLECSRKYKFSISVTLTTRPSFKKIITQSAQIFVEPGSLEILPAVPSLGLVSVYGDSTLRYNILTLSRSPKYEFYKSENGGAMIKIGESANNVYEDKGVNLEKNYYCYAYKYVNECGTKAELSGKSCNIRLSSESFGRITWTPFVVQSVPGFYKAEMAEYTIQVIDKSGTVMNTPANTTDTTFAIDVERFSRDWASYKFRVLSAIRGELNLGYEIVNLPLYSYSNAVSPYLILGNESSKNDLTVYPNPAEDKILINSSGAPVRFIEIIDMKGRIIQKGEISGNTFDLSAFEKGKYILRVYDGNKKLLNTKNIVKW